MEFVAIDIETANADMSSICQIGLAKYKDGVVVEEWCSLINPEDYFHPININIHGISEHQIIDAPKFPDVFKELSDFLAGTICVSHTRFDRLSIDRTIKKYSLENMDSIWLDSAQVARRAWEECARSGYGLSNVCKLIGYNFNHHDALEDAKACGQVLIAAIEKTGLDLDDWIERVCQPINPASKSTEAIIKKEGNPDGEFFGEVMVFTGALEIPRREAANLAASIGCTVATGVTKKTTLLVVGDQDITKLAGKSKSAKHLKAEELLSKGHQIQILKESDFKELVIQSTVNP